MTSSQPNTATSASQSASALSSRPPVTLGQTTHLDPGAYVRGTHAITVGEYDLVHPRAQLVAVHGPLSIGDRCIISEKCIIGGPVRSTSGMSSDPASKTPSAPGSGSNQPSPLINQGGADDADDEERDPMKTVIHDFVYVHPSSHVQAGATIREGVLIESNVTVLANVTVGAHAKICAGVTVDRNVEDWTVVYGNGNMKRPRKRRSAEEDQTELVEMLRLKAMDKEREGTVTLLRAAARTANLAKKK
ncbi:uncharacterized protein Z520_08527 [Fonsecaea multimorphosa CBS 102226]|uniref:Uncharacterized protein n=1 Tax=Fonsecaea multimorphosa CBS 102226 TaxID=1442371 RepID=A0A0D2JZ37_9EURO|nr:uncharacterized protein Z520_08527 [Fonsecaea multimorphosa CBS 102226]KIX95819.1 hypothetical protein Z520_08527 [Fonsecaea multimorphosa CBS 102226]OAL21555.1 hypothetical protein AYO22_07951 [Fonsecaea multimorphosa]